MEQTKISGLSLYKDLRGVVLFCGHFMAVLMLLGAVAALEAEAEATGATFAALSAPKTADWNPGDRWRDETHGGRPGVRLTANTSYGLAAVTGEVPESGVVMLRVTYYNHFGLRPFRIGVGAWGSPQTVIVPKPVQEPKPGAEKTEGEGWETAEIGSSVAAVRKWLKDGKVSLVISGNSAGMPVLNKVELYVPSREHLVKQFRDYVRTSTEQAWKDAKSEAFAYVGEYDSKTPLEPSDADTARGVMPFVRSYLIPMYPASVPTKKERVTKTSARMTPGEYEPVQIGIKALRDLPECQAEIASKLPEGLEAQVRWVECVPLRTAGGSTSKKWHVQPSRLWPNEIFPSCAVKKEEAQAWWVTFKAEGDLEPKTYPIVVSVRDGDRQLLEITIDLRILPFKLPESVDYAWGFYESNEIDEVTARDLVKHGCNSLSAWPNFRPLRGNKADFAAWDQYFAMLKAAGLDHSFAWYLGNKKNGWQVVEAAGAQAFPEILKAINQRVEDGRYPKNFCITIDEAIRSSRAWGQLKSLFQMMETHAPLLKRFGVSLNRHGDARKHEGLIDILSCNGDFEKSSAWCKKNGYGMYTYTVFTGRSSAHSARYNCGFNPWRYDATGTYGWALQWYGGNPYNDMDAGRSDWGIILPNWAGPPIATPAWEAFREGVDDRRYVEAYRKLVEADKAPASLLDELKQLLKEDQLSNEDIVGDSIFEAGLNDALKLKRARDRLIEGILAAGGQSD